jgi:(p)ppGpp synthase/HD superfamily hydrolase
MSHIDAHSTRDKQAVFNFILEVKNKPQLDDIIRKLLLIKGIIEVKRVE